MAISGEVSLRRPELSTTIEASRGVFEMYAILLVQKASMWWVQLSSGVSGPPHILMRSGGKIMRAARSRDPTPFAKLGKALQSAFLCLVIRQYRFYYITHQYSLQGGWPLFRMGCDVSRQSNVTQVDTEEFNFPTSLVRLRCFSNDQ